MKRVAVHTPYITLDQFLKWAELVESGGAAKELIADGKVLVNGEAEGRRGRKLYPGDVVEVAGRRFAVTSGKD